LIGAPGTDTREFNMSEFLAATAPTSRELVAFRIGQQEFCVYITAVREICGWTPAAAAASARIYEGSD